MKYAIVVSVFKTGFGPIVFSGSLDENIKRAAQIGYDGVELAIKKPEDINVNELKNILKTHNLTALTFGTGQIFFDQGLSFSDDDEKNRKNAVQNVKRIIDLASHFNASVIIGLVRGKAGNSKDNLKSSIEIAEERIGICLKECFDYSEKYGTKFLIEPINRYETNIFNTLDEVNSFINKYDCFFDLNRLGILADTFHMNIEEPVIERSLEKYKHLIKHLHFADSNRWAPGYGHINFKKIFKIIRDCNYNGYISFEIFPLPEPVTAAEDALAFVKKLER